MTTPFTVSRTPDLEIKTVIPMPERRELRITSRKNASRKSLQCTASVVQVAEDGRSFTHVFSLGGAEGDYFARIAEVPNGRATEKSLTSLHLYGIAKLDEVLAAAHAHYASSTN